MYRMTWLGPDVDAVVTLLRDAGAPFAFLHGSRATGTSRAGSDLDVAVWLGEADELTVRSRLPADVDPPARVEWQATTRKVFADERYRIDQARRDFADAHRG